MPTSIYIGDIPIEEAYLGDEVVGLDDNNVCGPCFVYTLAKDQLGGVATSVTASNCYNGDIIQFTVLSQTPRGVAISRLIGLGDNADWKFVGMASTTPCLNVYGKELQSLPLQSWTFTRTNPAQFPYVGYLSPEGIWGERKAGESVDFTACVVSGSFVLGGAVSASFNGAC
jgi:hypothetical protein